MKSTRRLQATDLATSVRHDLRDPLGAIAHWVQLLEATGLDDALRQRALQGIRMAVSEQIKQIEQLSGLLEQIGAAGPDGDPVSGQPAAASRVDLFEILNQVAQAIPPDLCKRLQRKDQESARPALLQANAPTLVQALSTLAMLGLKQLLDHERLVLSLQMRRPQGVCRMVMQVEVAAEPIAHPWQAMTDDRSACSLALHYAGSVLRLHRAEWSIATTDHADDTVQIDFPLDEPVEYLQEEVFHAPRADR